METQRQWSDQAIAPTTPARLGLFSLVLLLAQRLRAGQPLPTRSTAWYSKAAASFAAVMADGRRYLWQQHKFTNSLHNTRLVEFPASVLDDLLDTLCYVA